MKRDNLKNILINLLVIVNLLLLPATAGSQSGMMLSTMQKAEDLENKINQAEQIVQDIAIQIKKQESLPFIKVTLNFDNATLAEVLNTLSEVTDLNIVGAKDLSQRITAYLNDVSLDEALNTIFSATDYTYLREGKILKLIPLAQAPLLTKVFELRFVSAEQIKSIISGLMSARGNVQSFLKFSAEKESGTLIVRDTPEAIKNITEVIEKIDKKIRQVMIEAKFVEVTLDKDAKLGIDWVLQASFSGAKGQTLFPVGKFQKRLLERAKLAAEPTGTLTLGTISFEDFTAALHALDSQTKTDIISNPHISAREGEEAQITVGSRVPVPTYERNETTGSIQITGYQEEQIGVILRVTPLINADKSVTLQVHPEVSEITSFTGPNNERPVVSTREIKTALTIESGKTIVIGGLRSQNNSRAYSKIPLLGSIPIIGEALFKYRNNSDESTDLLIFLTPYILNE